MNAPPVFRRRLAAGLLLLATLAGGGLHHHEDLTGALVAGGAGASADRVLSSHSPLSRGAHWHSGVQVKDDPCLACQSQRAAGFAPEPSRESPLAAVFANLEAVVVAAVSATVRSNGSRAPPALL
jgi:hypothetical protein